MKSIINLAIDSAREAGILLADSFGKIKRIKVKGDRDLATNLDKQAEKIIVSKIKDKFPGHGILAEEGGGKNTGNDYLWIVDPLDGTHNYIRGISIFGVSIGVVYRGEFICGVIHMPMDDELYAAETGSGAFKNNKKILVSRNNRLKDSSISFDSAIRYAPKKMLPVLGGLAKSCFNLRMLGSSARALSYIAEGRLDAAVEFFDFPWDFAGGVCIVREAGGEFSGLRGGKLLYNTKGYLASNGYLHNGLLRVLNNI
ncbi:MAG: inositol monophosphatase [Candidatus Omnitrophota bacterium]|nr:inositol monophosphatase [Candidatus Omnitrophota bacterium]